ncbi:ATP-binding cassette domain-containing protein [bacterium]|nr:ATP-binding cassette domain-containing protein [bacterium]
MITTDNISLSYGSNTLFKNVSIKFKPGNCYGIIGANGCGKSTFLKILSGEIEPSSGNVIITKHKRIAVLKQDQFAFDNIPVLETVIRGHQRLFNVMQEKEAIYNKPDFSEQDGIDAADLETEFCELNGWDAEINAAKLLSDLDIKEDLHHLLMKELQGSQKIKVLLAQALFDNPDILIMDEPTNNLNGETIVWLENFLADFKNTVLLVSHDRHFLNKTCTHIVDIDYYKMTLYSGNYSFWQQASELAAQQLKDQNKRIETKQEELKAFIARFSANASKAKQATARKNSLEKLELQELIPSSRRYPFINFKPQREIGDYILKAENLTKTENDTPLIKDFSLTINRGDKIAFIGNALSISTLFNILTDNIKADSGKYTWGSTASQTYLPKENSKYFSGDLTILDWLKQYASEDKDEKFLRGFLGQMLFSGDDVFKKTNILSGGEKVRCMFARMMLLETNVLILDEPTNHLDLESITALNNGLIKTSCVVLFSSHDYEFLQTIANRIIEITPQGFIDRAMTYEEYIFNPKIKTLREELFV